MYTNDVLVLKLVALLKKFGIRKIVVSPGSRHNKLIRSLEYDNFFQLYLVVDERSAGFFALGLIQSSGEPVAVTCSSGTACMNYGSAIVEAYYQRLPLLVLSSDRVPELLNQSEDQMYDQANSFVNCTKYHCQLPVIDTPRYEWYCNRLINEALINLNHHGCGPVHINIPFAAHHGAAFNVEQLPDERKITLNQLPLDEIAWTKISDRLTGKKILVVWGQSVRPLKETETAEEEFAKRYNVAVITDNISNCHANNSFNNASITLSILKESQWDNLNPDIVITVGANYIFNNDMKGYLKDGSAEHWQVGMEDKISDPFHTLTEVFEMPEAYFFTMLAKASKSQSDYSYYNDWKIISDLVSLPQCTYCELYAITKLLKQLPAGVDLQLANSQTIRMAQFTPLQPDIRVNCNRGVNGIDGSMSTAVGFGADSKRPLFYITGELSFFYDMNSLSIRHISNQMRILLINNEGGAVMYDQNRDARVSDLPIYLAAGDEHTAKGWVESLGFKYLSAKNQAEVDDGINILLNDKAEAPIVLEVFTTLANDKFCINDYIGTQVQPRTLSEKIKGRLTRLMK